MKRSIAFFLSCTFFAPAFCQQRPIYQSGAFTVYPDKVVQGSYEGKAVSATELSSNYKSPANEFLSPAITFKFSINGKDNEMKSGIDHHYTCLATNGVCETPVIKFGTQLKDVAAVPDKTFLKPHTALKIKLDMRDVLKAFEKDGYYTTFSGDKIYKQDFKGVYVAGGTAPLSWDFDNLVNKPELKMQDDDGDGIYEANLLLNDPKNDKQTSASWKLSKDTKAFPQYKSDYPLSDALYNLAVEEMINAVEPDSTFRTGKEWAGVWTRDISYSIILSMAHMQPKVAKNSLLRKVKNGKIIQDTGTGGAYPVSTDRVIWATAAWELYKAMGDKDWLRQAYEIIKNTVEDDRANAFDKQTGLMRGESSFLDWREQTYPRWMQPVDIYLSECLGTNAAHYQANRVLSYMALLLKDAPAAKRYQQFAEGIKTAINNHLWVSEKGYYGQFIYGRNKKIISPKSESLGEALSVLFGIADDARARQVISSTPVMPFGVPCIYPQIPNIPPYHNNAVWPFVQSYFALAAAKVGNEAAVMESIAAIYRPAALWLTNKENFVASNGDFAGTQINSSNMLWSLSGSIGIVQQLLFGIQYNKNNLTFKPFVPFALRGKRSLTNFNYRDAVLDIEMEGYGNRIKTFMLDGKPASPTIMDNLKSRHQVKIILADNDVSGQIINSVTNYETLDNPKVILEGHTISWNKIEGAKQYTVLKNGQVFTKTTNNRLDVNETGYNEYQVIAVDAQGVGSFASEPVGTVNKNNSVVIEVENFASKAAQNYQGFMGTGFVEISKSVNARLNVTIDITEAGTYALDFRYANGNGPTNTENKCAVRTISEGNKIFGTLVFPQRGKEEWSNWGWSNAVQHAFTKGKHTITLFLAPANENMNVDINQAMLDEMRLIKLK